ncbi:MAG TPA: toast rack family protein [Bryobacteraceae bacterium]|jgi:hypothetical protein|nr:toast rack family protein [Bryobacteraceae bacterium]
MTKAFATCFVVGMLALGGCEFDRVVTGPIKTDNISLDLNNAQHANIELDLGAGELTVRGGSPKLLAGRIEYNVPSWAPEVTDNNNGQTADVSIKQNEHGHSGGNMRNRWDLSLNNDVLTDFRLNCGAGQARLELGDVMLSSVTVHMGAGQVDLDLQGHPTRNYSVNVQGGVGQATIRLPRDVGIRAEAHGGLGSISVDGLNKRGGFYTNDAYGTAKVNVLVQVEGGIGEIKIIA